MKRIGLLGGAALLLGMSSGCCWWADHWCPQRNYPAAYAPPPAAPVCCQPVPQPCQPCPPGCAPSGYAPTWQNAGAAGK